MGFELFYALRILVAAYLGHSLPFCLKPGSLSIYCYLDPSFYTCITIPFCTRAQKILVMFWQTLAKHVLAFYTEKHFLKIVIQMRFQMWPPPLYFKTKDKTLFRKQNMKHFLENLAHLHIGIF